MVRINMGFVSYSNRYNFSNCTSARHRKIIFTILIGLGLFSVDAADHQQIQGSCLKPACIDAASEIQQNIDPSIQPCDDFYNFACGGFSLKTNILENTKGFDMFNNISSAIDEQTKLMIEEATGNTNSKAFRLVKKLYETCTNTAAIEREGVRTINHYIDELGGWPLMKPEALGVNDDRFDWLDLSWKLRKLGFGDYLVTVSVEADPQNNTRRILTVGYPHLVVHKEWNDKKMEAYRKFLVNVAVSLGANRDSIVEEIQEVTNFELYLATILGQEQERRMSIRELEFNYPGIPWLQYINNIVDDDGDGVSYDDAVVVKSPQFVLNFIQLVRQVFKRILTNYLVTRAVTSMLPYSTNALRNEDLSFRKNLHPSTEYDPRWKECIHAVSGRLHVATAALYAQKYFKDHILNGATKIAIDIQREFSKSLLQTKWMEHADKEFAQEKLDRIKTYIGFPKELLDNQKVEEYYSLIEPEANSYLQLVKKIDAFTMNKHYKQLQKSTGEMSWVDQAHANTIAAFYNPRKNALIFPAGLLQEPFYNSERPRYMNYATLGSLIGHELVHGFDNQGKHYAEDGGFENWWSPKTESNYVKATHCINEHYANSGSPEVGLNVNHLNSPDEIIADVAGVKQAYLAYQSWLQQNNPKELPLPGLNYTQNQLFWISAASMWCSKYQNSNGEVYFPGSFRVYEAFRNLEEFSNDFDCPLGSNMNPEQKCTVW